ncbi:MAG: hypothetical protein CL563_08060 [Alphaproteobacteria bacterium]|nr:hypothetical protein [Alphaproteobacteria bacterium]MEC7944295.1 hypothetical protein [Pseudomonadota bacterium]
MNYNLKLLALTTLFITIAANSAHAHAIGGAEAGLLHLVSNMDHMLVLLMTVFLGSIAIVKGRKICRVLRASED